MDCLFTRINSVISQKLIFISGVTNEGWLRLLCIRNLIPLVCLHWAKITGVNKTRNAMNFLPSWKLILTLLEYLIKNLTLGISHFYLPISILWLTLFPCLHLCIQFLSLVLYIDFKHCEAKLSLWLCSTQHNEPSTYFYDP